MTVSHLSPGAAYDATAGGRGSLPAVWAGHWERASERAWHVAPDGARADYGELEAETRRLAGRLHGAGLRPGDRVLMSAETSPAVVTALLACLRLGLAVVPANTAYAAAELAHLVSDARPKLAIVDGEERAAFVRAADARVRIAGSQLALQDADPPPLDAVAPDAPALIAYTSGTTGRPKGAVLTHANLLASVEALRLAWRWTADDRLVLALPLFHMHGLGVGLLGSLHAGASVTLLARFEPRAVVDAIRRAGATLFFGVPTMYHRLVDSSDADAFRELRLCVSGSAPLPAVLHRRFEDVTGQRILERYGMTETAMLVSNPVEGERRPGTVGLPLPGVELRLAGDPPEIQVRGPNVTRGYWERPDATAEGTTADGWFRTGDLGSWDDAGYLRIDGRAKELVITGGLNVHPREVEDALREHPEIEDAAVVGTPSAEWGEEVTAYLVSPRAIALAELRDFLAGRLAPFKHPRRLHRVAALPRNALGKLQKHELRADD